MIGAGAIMSKQWPQGPWDQKWKFVSDLSSGGQGTTYRVASKEDGSHGVLKILHDPENEKCRVRMYQETSALRALKNRRIARLVDTNAEEFGKGAELYLVTEYIGGPTLREAVAEPLPPTDESFELVLALCEALDYAHDRPLPVFHRDIKPENIVLRGHSFSDPVLIDFGIAFNAADSDRMVTDTTEKLGNRFLWLPEQQPGSSFKRDHRTDLTQVVGVLFFLVTGEDPVMLLDPEERMPHERAKAKKHLDAIEASKGQLLKRVFDTGFLWRIDRRVQSVQALRLIMKTGDDKKNQVDLSDLREMVLDRRAAKDPVYNDQVVFRSARDQILLGLYGPILDLSRQIDGFKLLTSGAQIDFSTMTFEYRTGLRDLSVPEIGFEVTFVVRATGNEIVIIRQSEERDTEVSRVPFEAKPDLSGLRASLTDFYRRQLDKAVRSM